MQAPGLRVPDSPPAAAEGLRITGTAETHIQADFVSGSRELADSIVAKRYLSDEGPDGNLHRRLRVRRLDRSSGPAGVGGGFVIVPALVLFSGISIHRAVGTSLMVIALVSVSGVSAQAWAGRGIDPVVTTLFVAESWTSSLTRSRTVAVIYRWPAGASKCQKDRTASPQ